MIGLLGLIGAFAILAFISNFLEYFARRFGLESTFSLFCLQLFRVIYLLSFGLPLAFKEVSFYAWFTIWLSPAAFWIFWLYKYDNKLKK